MDCCYSFLSVLLRSGSQSESSDKKYRWVASILPPFQVRLTPKHAAAKKPSLFLLSFLFVFFKAQPQDTIQVAIYRLASVDTIKAVEVVKKGDPAGSDLDTTTNHFFRAATFTKRKKLVAYTGIGLYGGALLALNQAWYSGYPRSSFHTFNDNAEWLQTDKVGHSWSAYQLARLSYGAWRWAGTTEKKAVLLGGLSGPGFLTVIEILDGFSSEWGWSWGDMGANVFGGGLFVAQQLKWHEQRIDFKFSTHRINYKESALIRRADQLFGSSLPERFLKDYNGQTYWLSANIHSFFKQSSVPGWLNLAVGYGANGMFGAFENIAKDPAGGTTFSRQDIRRYRQLYLSPDIKWSRIPTKGKFLKTLFIIMDGIKFPLPGLEYGNGKWIARGLLF